jgi:hypothetical protein
MLSVYLILAPATDGASSPGVDKAIPLTPLDASLNGPTMDARQTRLGTYGNWLYGTASLLSRPHSRYCATLGLLDKLNTAHLALVLLSFPGSSLPSLTR